MKRNISGLDKNIRLLLAAVVAILYFTNTISGTLSLVLGIVALVLVLTVFINFCPIYRILGISSYKKK